MSLSDTADGSHRLTALLRQRGIRTESWESILIGGKKHSVGRVINIEAIIAVGKSGRSCPVNAISMSVVRGDRNKEMNGMNSPVVDHKSRDFRFGSKGSLVVRSCRTERTSEDEAPRAAFCARPRILWAYFRKQVHSSVVGSFLRDFGTK